MPDIFDASKASKAEMPDPDPDSIDSSLDATEAATTTPDEPSPVEEAADKPNPRTGRHVDEYSMVMKAEEPSNNPLRSYVPKPSRIFFASQQADEKVLLLLRRHPVTQVRWILIAIGLALLPTVFNMIGLFNFFPARFQFAATVGWYLLIIGFVLESFLTWFYNVYIITDERIIDVDFYNLLFKNISTAKIDKIEDVTIEEGGILASVFNYGTVKIQTAGTVTEFEFEDVPQPAKVTAFLNEMLLEEEREVIEGRVS